MTCPCARPPGLSDEGVREALARIYPQLPGEVKFWDGRTWRDSAGNVEVSSVPNPPFGRDMTPVVSTWHVVGWVRCGDSSPQIRGPGQPDACDAGVRCHFRDGHEGRHRIENGHPSSWWFSSPGRLSGGRGSVPWPSDPPPWPVPCWVTTAAEAEMWRPAVRVGCANYCSTCEDVRRDWNTSAPASQCRRAEGPGATVTAPEGAVLPDMTGARVNRASGETLRRTSAELIRDHIARRLRASLANPPPGSLAAAQAFAARFGGRVEEGPRGSFEVRVWGLDAEQLEELRHEHVSIGIRVVDMDTRERVAPIADAVQERRDGVRALVTWVQGVATVPPSPSWHLSEVVSTARHWLTTPARWWKGRERRRAAIHAHNVTRALVNNTLGAGTSGLPIGEDDE